MNKTKEVRNFFYSQYFADGVRISIGTLVPALVFALFGNIEIGVWISMGAMLVGLSDSTGPVSARKNGMFVCLGVVVFMTLLTNLINVFPMLLLAGIVIFSFVFSMFAVFGARASAVGSMGILAIVLNTDILEGTFLNTLELTLFVLIGGLWYILLSLSLSQARPYRLAQQELGECVHQVAKYIRLKAKFYAESTPEDYEKNFLALIEQQVLVNDHQEQVRDLVFRGKKVVKDTTKIGRILILIFSDINDLFEQSMATQYDYTAIQQKYGHTGILKKFHNAIHRIANELDNLGYEINANQRPKPLYNFKDDLDLLVRHIEKIEKEQQLNTLPLKKILINIRNLVQRVEGIYGYFYMPKNTNTIRREEADYSKFINKNPIDWKALRENLNLQSSTFRHAIRMGVVMGIGYLCSLFFEMGTHSYWVLLTILVILRPGFGLTKQRNFQRLTGTIIGGISGAIILLLVQDKTVLFVLLMAFMIATYSLIRINYIISVMFMTPYVLIMLTFFEQDIFTIVRERIFDTMIGSSLAFISSYIILPNWESNKVQEPMRALLKANYQYLANALRIISGQKLDITAYKLARKEVYIATGNMGSAFQRLITEPKSKQKMASELNKFVVFNHILSSYSVTLMNQVRLADNSALTGEHVKIIRKTLYLLAQSIRAMPIDPHVKSGDTTFEEAEIIIPQNLDDNNIDSPELRLITEQLQFLNRIASDIHKTCEQITLLQGEI